MIRLTSDKVKNSLIEKLKSHNFKNKILLLSQKPSPEVNHYKKVIIKRCEEFGISYVDKVFDKESQEEILNFINSNDKDDGFIILAPFGDCEDLSLLKEKIILKDLDSFTYESLGRVFDGKKEGLPATARAVVNFMDDQEIDYKGKNIVIANNTNVIGRPLATYLQAKRASVKVLNSLTKNSKDFIKEADIFISAIGKAEFYDRSYFKNGAFIIDVGTSYKNGKIVGDVDIDSIKDLNLSYLGSKKGIGAITTITLLEGLLY